MHVWKYHNEIHLYNWYMLIKKEKRKKNSTWMCKMNVWSLKLIKNYNFEMSLVPIIIPSFLHKTPYSYQK
jgi:hypothetical protein